jgi:hypothetical protein
MNGRFETTGLPPGEFRVHLEVLPSLGIGGRIYVTIEHIEIDLLGTREGASLQRPVQGVTVSLTGSDAQRRIRSGAAR